MAVADPRLEEWEEWKSEMEKSRRTSWRERVSRWPEVQARDGADAVEEEVEEEAKETNSEDEEASEDKEETEAGEMGEEEGDDEMEREAQEVDAGEGRRVTEIKNGDEEEEGERKSITEVEQEDGDINELTEMEEAQGKGENEEEEEEEVSEDSETEEGGMGKEEGDEMEMREAQEMDVGEGRRVMEIKNGDEVDEEEEGEMKSITEDGEEDNDIKEVTEMEEAQGNGENEDEDEEEEDRDDEKEEVREDTETGEGGMGKEEGDEMERESQEMDVGEEMRVMEIKNGDEEEEREGTSINEDEGEDNDIKEVTEIEEAQGNGENEEEEDRDNEKEEVSEDSETEESGMGKEEGDEMERESQEMDVGEEMRVMEIKNGDEEEEREGTSINEDEGEDNDIKEVTEMEEAQGNGENEDGEEEEEEDIDDEKEEVREDMETEEGGMGKKEGDEMEIREAQEMDVEEERRVMEIKNVDEVDEEEGEEGEEEGERKSINEDEEEEDIDDEKEEVREDTETGEGGMGREEEEDEMEMRKEKDMEEEAENEVGAGIEVDEERDEKKVEELEEEGGKEAERNINEAIIEDEEEDSDMKEPGEMQEARENGETELEREVRKKHDEQKEREEVEKIVQYYMAEQLRERMRRTEDENIQHNQGSTRREDTTVNEDENLPESVSESRTTPDERSQEELQDEEEDSTDYEEADEDVDNYDEEVVKIYRRDDYLAGLFGTLKTFRDTSLLTDLTLSTDDGAIFHVHSLVIAAVSLRIRESLSGGSAVSGRPGEGEGGGVRLHRWSVSLGPEVDRVGLEAVVEFAYTGLMSRLEKDTVQQITAAAETLRAPRVLERCTARDEEDNGISAEEQMMVSRRIIEQLRKDRVGCDVVLEAVGGSLHVHRVILAVWSDYFRSMFTLGMKESHQPCVTLPFLLASELEVLIDFSYSGALPLSWKCVFEITSTSLQLQYEPTLSLGLEFLQQEMNPHSCLDVASFAEAYEMARLLEVADDFVLHHFQKVACTAKFKDLPVNKLLWYLNSLSLCVPSELVVFRAVAAWIQAKPKARLEHAQEMMKSIHFTLMTFREFNEVQTQNMWSDHSQAELFGEICENFCSNENAPQSQCRIYLPKESLVLVGGDETSEDLSSRSISRELWFGNSLRNHTGIKKAVEWRRLGEMPDAPRFSHEVAVLKGQLYVFGGKNYYGTDDTLSSVYRYDPLRDSWEGLAAMQEKRCSFSVVVLDGKIYAVGGHRDPDYLETVEQYSPITNSWRFTCPLDLPQRAHVAKVLQGKIFVSGGMFSDSQCLSHMFQYHPETGSTYLADMAKPRANHCMEVMGDCLYVAGGITMGDVIHLVDQLSCEVYNPAADSWTAFACLPVPHVGAGSAVLEGKFYVLGGYSHEEYSDTKIVHRYDPTMQRWENMGMMPGPNNDIRASLLCLPPHFRL